jgi:predicted dehydrogenase
MKSIGVGLIGCGGRLSGVARRVTQTSPRIKVVALCDTSRKSIANAKNRMELDYDPTVYKDHRDLVRNADVEWVMVGSWNCFHKEHVVAALRAGKHVFCEKPIATNLADCVAMKKAWKKSGRMFVMGFNLRYSPHYKKIKELVDRGTIGEVMSMEFNETLDFNHGGFIMGDWRRHEKLAGTHLLEKCCHDVDLANWIVGSPASRAASFGGLDFFLPKNRKHIKRVGKDRHGRRAYWAVPWRTKESKGVDPFTRDKDIIDNQVAIIEYRNGPRATFHTNCNSAIPERRMYILGSEGAIRADVMRGKLEVKRIGFNTKSKDVSPGAKGGHGGGDVILAKAIVDAMLKGKPPRATLEDGMKSAITCFAMDDSRKKGKIINLAPYWKRAGIRR